MNTDDENSWRANASRADVVKRIDEAIQEYGIVPAKSSTDIESHVFHNSKSKEEYQTYVNKLLAKIQQINAHQMTGQPMSSRTPANVNRNTSYGSSDGHFSDEE